MAFTKETIDLKGILFLMLLTIPSQATNLDCYGKAFHCVNSTHFMICVDLGTGLSTTIDDVVIPCPSPTVCRPSNRFECEFLPISAPSTSAPSTSAPSTSAPVEVSTIANIVTTESEVTFIPLGTSSIPFEEYFNTLSPTTLSESQQQTTIKEPILTVAPDIKVLDITNATQSETVIALEPIAKNVDAKTEPTTDVNPESSLKQNDVNNNYVDNNTSLNLNVIPYGVTTINYNQELTTSVDTLNTPITDPPILNTYDLGEQTMTTTGEIFTQNFQEPTTNSINPELFSIASVTPVEPTTQIEEVVTSTIASEPVNNIIGAAASLSDASTNFEITTNAVPKNDIKLNDFNVKNNETVTTFKTSTVVNEVSPSLSVINDQSNTSSNNMEYKAIIDMVTTEMTTAGVTSNTYYEESLGSTTRPIHVPNHLNYPSFTPESTVTAEYTTEVNTTANVSEFNKEVISNNAEVIGESTTTESYTFFSIVENANINNASVELNLNISYNKMNATKKENKQELITVTVAQEPVTEVLSLTTVTNALEHVASSHVGAPTVTLSSNILQKEILKPTTNFTKEVPNSINTTASNIATENATAYYSNNNNVKTLTNLSTTVNAAIELATENVINNLQSGTENIGFYDLNNTRGNTKDRLTLNDKGLSTNKEENKTSSSPMYKPDLNNETVTLTPSTHDVVQVNEFLTTPQPQLPEETAKMIVAEDGINISTTNLNLDSLNNTSLPPDTMSLSEFVTLSTTLPLSPISTNGPDLITAIDITNQINDSVNTAQKNVDNSTFSDTQTVTTDKPSTNIFNILSTVQEHTDIIISSNINKLTVTTFETINKSSIKTETVKPTNVLPTENIEYLSQTDTIQKPSTSLPTTEIKSFESPSKLPEHVSVEQSNNYSATTTIYNITDNTGTETDTPVHTTSSYYADLLNKTSLHTESMAASSTLSPLLSISPISINKIDIFAVDIKSQDITNDNNNTAFKDGGNFTSMNTKTVTTNISSKNIQDVDNNSKHTEIVSTVNTDKVIPLEPNKFTAAVEIIKSSTTTATMDTIHNLSEGTLHQTNTITMDTTTSLPTTEIKTGTGTFVEPTENYPYETSFTNINDIIRTETQMSLQSTRADLSLTSKDPFLVLNIKSTNELNNREQGILPHNHIVADGVIAQNIIYFAPLSTAAINTEATTFATEEWQKNNNKEAANSLNKAIDHTTERSTSIPTITTASVLYPSTVQTQLLVPKSNNTPTGQIMENIAESTLRSYEISSNFNPETIKLTPDPMITVSNKNSDSTKKASGSLWPNPTVSTEINYDVTMTHSTIATQEADNVKIGYASKSLTEMLLSNAIMVAETHGPSNDTVRNNFDTSVNANSNNDHSLTFNLTDGEIKDPSTSMQVLLENSTLIEDLAQTTPVKNQIIVPTETIKRIDESVKSPDFTLPTYNPLMQTTADKLVMTSTNSPILRENNLNTIPEQVFGTGSYFEPVSSSPENVINFNSTSTKAQNQEPISSTYAYLNKKTAQFGDKNEEVTVSPNELNLLKSENIYLGENKTRNSPKQELNLTSSIVTNESNNNIQTDMNPKIDLVVQVTNSRKIDAARNYIIPVIVPTKTLLVQNYVNSAKNQESFNDKTIGELLHISKAENRFSTLLKTEVSPMPSNLNTESNNLSTAAISSNKNENLAVTPKTELVDEPNVTIAASTLSSSSITPLTYPMQKTKVSPMPPNLNTESSNLSTATTSNNKYVYLAVTTKTDLVDEPKATIAASTLSLSSIIPLTYPMQKTTLPDNSIGKSSIYLSVTEPIDIQTNDIPKNTQLLQDKTTKSIGNEPIAQADRSAYLLNTPTPVNYDSPVTKRSVTVSLPINLDTVNKKKYISTAGDVKTFDLAYTAQNVKTEGYSNIGDQLPLDVTEISGSTVSSKIQLPALPSFTAGLKISTTPTTITSFETYRGSSQTPKDTIGAIANTSLASQVFQPNLSKITEDSFVLKEHLEIDVPVTTAFTTSPDSLKAVRKTDIDELINEKGFVTNSEIRSSSIVQKPVIKDIKIVENNTQHTSTQSTMASSSADAVGVINTSTDVLVDNNTAGEKTHSGIISLITHTPNQPDSKETKGISKNSVREIKEISKTSSNLVKKRATLLNLSVPSTDTSLNKSSSRNLKNNSTREELLLKPESNNFKLTNSIFREALYSTATQISIKTANVMDNTGSERNKGTPTLELNENNTTFTNGSHTSNNKSKDQNSIVSAYNMTVISNDQSSTPRYMSHTKSTAAGDAQTTELPAFESTTNKSESKKFSCKQKKRGKYADELDCRKFYICLGNSHMFEGTCPVNTVFSEIRKQCTKNLSHCIRNNQFRCVTEGRFGDFLNDNVYYLCARNNLTSFIRFKLRCQNGYHLNKTSVRCVLNNESRQSSSSSDSSKNSSDQSASSASKQEEKEKPEKKFKCKKEGLFADPSDCVRYFECTKSDNSEYRQKRKKCGKDENFHRDKKKCVDDDSYECN